MNKTEKERIPVIKAFNLNKVKIMDTYCNNAMKKELDYLLELEPDKLLAGFYERQGKKAKNTKYSGWETSEIQGHTLGHYLTALAQAYRYSESEELLERLHYLISELKNCQTEDGFFFASSEELFDRVEQRKPAWVPWYTMHKIVAGIIAVYQAINSEDALAVLNLLGKWIFNRVSLWSESMQKTVLAVEYGGMNDVLYDLYKITGNQEHLFAAHCFDELPLFEAMAEGKDILNGKHANTTIPKIIGALNRYMTLGEEEELYLRAAVGFWDIVTRHHTYITGGNSEWEHFGLPDVLDKERTNCNCETCNSYNMLKLSKMLFEVIGERKYADFYESTQINSILSSQNPETGMTTYFQPMDTGYFKVYGTPFDKFWCCTGTGMENFTKLNDGIYFKDKECIYINRFVGSEVLWDEKGVKITQETDIPNSEDVVFKISEAENKQTEFTLCIRVPDWVSSKVQAAVNGIPLRIPENSEYLKITRKWEENDRIIIKFPLSVRAITLPDNPDVYGFTYGPVVLSAALGTQNKRTRQTGVAVDIPLKEIDIKDFIVLKGDREEWLKELSNHLVKDEGDVAFRLRGTDEDNRLIFTPHYKQYVERYGIYWRLYGENSSEMQEHLREERSKEEFEKSVIDRIPLGNDQYELSHHIQGEHTHSGERLGYIGRITKSGGWISFQMEVDQDCTNILSVAFHRWDSGKVVRISIDEKQLVNYCIKEDEEEDRLIRKKFIIPVSMTKGKKSVEVKFQAENSENEFSIWDYLLIFRVNEDK